MNMILFLYQLIFAAGTSMIGAALAFFITSQYVYNKVDNKDDDESDEEETIDFEEMYQEEFENLERKELPEADLLETFSSTIDTPLGEVVMNYDIEEKCYIYYTDSRNIPVRFLNVAARKFVVDHDCLSLYEEEKQENVDEESEQPSASAPATTPTTTPAPSYYEKIASMFTWRKSDQSVPEPDEPEPEADEPESNSESEQSEEEEEEATEASVFATYKKSGVKNVTTNKVKNNSHHVKKIMNKYRYAGSLLDHENKQQTQVTEALELSFLKYKELIKNKNE